ncbi:MAG: hypothetical protein HQK63_05985 [Desulfamplus sp.]|nr:hypothetical protein [Desulfamplus sp.]
MIQTVEAILSADGEIHLLSPLYHKTARRVFVTILEERPTKVINSSETALLSEASLGEDWNREEEDQAWLHLQSEL